MTLITIDQVSKQVQAACIHYDNVPVVSQYLEDLYERINERRETVTLDELFTVTLLSIEGWVDTNLALNLIGKCLSRNGHKAPMIY